MFSVVVHYKSRPNQSTASDSDGEQRRLAVPKGKKAASQRMVSIVPVNKVNNKHNRKHIAQMPNDSLSLGV